MIRKNLFLNPINSVSSLLGSAWLPHRSSRCLYPNLPSTGLSDTPPPTRHLQQCQSETQDVYNEQLPYLSRLSELLGAGTKSHYFYCQEGDQCSRKLNLAQGNAAREEQRMHVHRALPDIRTCERNLLSVQSYPGSSACFPRLALIPPPAKPQ